jgi:hypothetical protein
MAGSTHRQLSVWLNAFDQLKAHWVALTWLNNSLGFNSLHDFPLGILGDGNGLAIGALDNAAAQSSAGRNNCQKKHWFHVELQSLEMGGAQCSNMPSPKEVCSSTELVSTIQRNAPGFAHWHSLSLLVCGEADCCEISANPNG